MACEEVPADAKVDRQFPAPFPIVLDVSTDLQVPPVAEVVRQMSRLGGDEARVHAPDHPVRRVRREEELVEEVIRGPGDVEFAVFYIPPEIPPDLDAVFPSLEGHH